MLYAVAAAVTGAPEYRDFISAGTYILGTIVVTFGGIQVALINRANTNAKRAAEHAEPTGNGFARETRSALIQVERSLGALHGRMDERERHSQEARQEVREVLVNFDNRLTHIEDKL